MRPPPLHVMACNKRTAEAFVEGDLKDSRRRLHYIDDPNFLRGRHDRLVIYVHPTANGHRNYRELMYVAELQGCILLKVDDSFARKRYYREQQEYQAKADLSRMTLSNYPKFSEYLLDEIQWNPNPRNATATDPVKTTTSTAPTTPSKKRP